MYSNDVIFHCSAGGSNMKTITAEPRSAHSKANASQEKAKGLKGTKVHVSFEEEKLYCHPKLDVHSSDHPLDPVVARNMAEGVILPTQAADFAGTHTNVLLEDAYMHAVMV
jgi:hypothetical protein